MRFFNVASIVIADRPDLSGHDWQAGLLGFFEGLLTREEHDIITKPHLVLRGKEGVVVVRYERECGGFIVLGRDGRKDQIDVGALNPIKVRGFMPYEALAGAQALAHRKTSALQLQMSIDAELCLIPGESGLVVGHAGLPSSLDNLGGKIATFANAAKSLAIA